MKLFFLYTYMDRQTYNNEQDTPVEFDPVVIPTVNKKEE